MEIVQVVRKGKFMNDLEKFYQLKDKSTLGYNKIFETIIQLE